MTGLHASLWSRDPNYQGRLKAEIARYSALYQDEESRRGLLEKVPPSWRYIEEKSREVIRQANQGRWYVEEAVAHLQANPGGRALSLGSGPGGLETEIARRLAGSDYEMVCLDLNPDLLELGRRRAAGEGLNIKFAAQDINALSLEPEQFDVILCYASLHHFINLEHIFEEMKRALRATGKVVVVDIISRNGYRMWDETYEIVRSLW